MVSTEELRIIFPDGWDDDAISSEMLYYSIMRNNRELLEPLGHRLWMFPISHVASLIQAIQPLTINFNKESICSYFLYVMNIPDFIAGNLKKSINAWKEYLGCPVATWIKSSQSIIDELDYTMTLSDEVIVNIHKSTLYFLFRFMICLRHSLAQLIVSEAEIYQPQEVPNKAHPVWKLYKPEDSYVTGGSVIGDGIDTMYGKSLISSNDISGLLVKLKTVYMRAAYLQLIQTLSQLAEKKSYKIITFRQDELSGVLQQIQKLSSDTFRQLKLEDDLISKICFNIIKIIDPEADLKKTMTSLSLDIGDYPASAYALRREVFD